MVRAPLLSLWPGFTIALVVYVGAVRGARRLPVDQHVEDLSPLRLSKHGERVHPA